MAGAVGLAKALEMAVQKRQKESGRLTKLRNYAIAKILKNFPNVSLNGDLENRLPNNINICLGSVSQGDTLGKKCPKGVTLGFRISCHQTRHTRLCRFRRLRLPHTFSRWWLLCY